MSLKPRQQTDAEWDSARPMIEYLYIRKCRPLSTVIQTMEACYSFSASTAMYKRKLRVWGTYKNSRYRTQPLGNAILTHDGLIPRYMRQNVLDESLHTVLDLLTPWIAHTDFLWNSAKRMHCPPRAAFVYDEFTQSIVAAVDAFRRGDTACGGLNLRRAFVELEHTLTPTLRSVFTLHSLFFALAVLYQAGLSKASKLLITHATNLAALRTLVHADTTQGGNSSLGLMLDPVPGLLYQSGHLSHPFSQILQRLQVLAVELENSNENAMQAILRTWSAYHRISGQASARSVTLQLSQREFWKGAIRTQRSSSMIPAKVTSWVDKIKPVLKCLYRLLDYTKAPIDDDFRLASLDEIVSIYSLSRSERFEETALELVSIARDKSRTSTGTDLGILEQWGCNASLELANFYLAKNDMEKAFKSFYNIVPENRGTEWEAILLDEFQCWKQEQGEAEESRSWRPVT